MNSILKKVNSPQDLHSLSIEEMVRLAEELRFLIVNTVSRTGGHLAANLGVIELTIAMLKVFEPPKDKFVWDVGHQTYAYKILTGRRDQFHTLRQSGGISGFTKRGESEYDSFGAGHAGTALSAGLGMAYARDRRGGDEDIVVISGDASIGCGIALEALNNIDGTARKLIVVLNDNEMSISGNVGSISRYLGSLLASPRYNRWKRTLEGAARRARLDWLRHIYYRVEEALKSLFLRSVIFEEFGLRYIGPIDGHNIPALVDAFTVAKDYDKPILLHISTNKGKGYPFAEHNPEKWHGTPGFDVATGESVSMNAPPGYSSIMGDVLARMAETDDRLVAITAAMKVGTGLAGFAEKYPDRFFDVGMSEEHAVVFAAGLATEGIRPIVAVYSTFMQRSIDCIIHDVCLQHLPVVMCLDRAGIVGDDGPTHHGVFDIALLRPVPGLVIMQPRNESELANMLYTAVNLNKPVVIRYPRGAGSGMKLPADFSELPIGKAEEIISLDAAAAVLATSRAFPVKRVAIWALGDMIQLAQDTAAILSEKGVSSAIVNARFIKPIDQSLIIQHAQSVDAIITIENGVIAGGFGAGIEEFLNTESLDVPIVKVGWPDEFIPQGRPDVLMNDFGLTASAISSSVLKRLRLV